MQVRISQHKYNFIRGVIESSTGISITPSELIDDLNMYASECNVDPKDSRKYLIHVNTPLLSKANRYGAIGGAFIVLGGVEDDYYTVDYLLGFSKPPLPTTRRMNVEWYY